MNVDDEVDVQIHFLVYDYLKRTNQAAAKVKNKLLSNTDLVFAKEFKHESSLDLGSRPKNLGTLEGWWRDFEASKYYDNDDVTSESDDDG